jgi:hypothetical protein
MLSVYLFCLVIGGGFALISAFGDFLDADADVDMDVDVDVDLDFDVHLDADAHLPTTVGGVDAGHAAAIFSLRSIIFSLFGFGATGSLLTLVGANPTGLSTVVLAVGAGLLVGAAVGAFLSYLKRSDSGAQASEISFVGLRGRVTLPLGAGSPGHIMVQRGNREHSIRALPFPGETEGSDPADWDRVVVIEMRKGVAYVGPLRGEDVDLLE